MKINKNEIERYVNQYSDCTIEEIFENDVGNFCIITCNLKKIGTIDNCEVYRGGIDDLLSDLQKYDNINNMVEKTYIDDDGGYYEYVSFEWS